MENSKKEMQMLDDIYKNIEMGTEATLDLMPKVEDAEMRRLMTMQIKGYEELKKNVSDEIKKKGGVTPTSNPLTVLSAKMGINMNTMIDKTTSHIAQMMIEGSTMDITDLLQKITAYENEVGEDECSRLARTVVDFEERNVEKMKGML